MQRIITFLTFLLISLPIIPCGNSYRPPEDLDAYSAKITLSIFRFREKFDQSVLMNDIQILGDEIKKGLNIFQDENDRALTFMRVGEYGKALEILQHLEKQKPNEYNIVANLGTLYELTGENEKALGYIKKAMKLDVQSHHGSEWFHIQVLEAKLGGKDESWWETHTVLNLSSVKKNSETILSDITYQLKERIPFTPKPNIMMASILNQSAAYMDQQGKKEEAWVLYRIAVEYDKDSSFSLRPKLNSLEKYFDKNDMNTPNIDFHYMRSQDILEQGKDLLERGIELYTGEKPTEKVEKKKENTNTLFLLLGGAIVLVLALAFYSLRNKKHAA